MVAQVIDAQEFRNAMAAVSAPVAVLTTVCDSVPFGTTVSSLSSLSLEPRLVGVALGSDSELLSFLRTTLRLGVNLLGYGQQHLAVNFGRKGGADTKFEGIEWVIDDGLPRLAATPLWLSCSVRQFTTTGDHCLVVAEVVEMSQTESLPLVYAHRTFGTHSTLKELAER